MSVKPTPIQVHPAAAVFPMMTDQELADLAADIKANGQIHDIILDENGMLVDGRNRLRACEIAGVKPRFGKLNGHDAESFIISANIARRDLTKSQKAMALAMIFPEPGQKGVKKLDISRSDQTLLGQARAILRHSKEMAEDILYRGEFFDVALKKVQAEAQKRKSHNAQLNELRDKVPDIAAMVEDGRLTLEEGQRSLWERRQEVQKCIEAARDSLDRFIGLSPHITIIKQALALSDQDLALVGTDWEHLDLFEAMSDQDMNALSEASDQLRQMFEPEEVVD